jgi:hypothetical protein
MSQSIATVRSLKWVDYLYFALLEPRRLIVRISDESSRPYWGALFIVLLSSFAEILASSLVVANTQYFYLKMTYGVLLLFLVNAVKIAVIVLLIDALCQFMSFTGSMKTLFPLVAYAHFPQSFILPLVYIFKVLSFAPVFFLAALSLALAVWTSIIVISGISEMHSMPFTKSALVFLFPYAAVGIIAFLIALLGIINIFGYLAAH